MTVPQRLTGTAVRRVEDPRILSGRGCYVDDVTLPGQLHAAFLRSPLPHARLASIDVTAARRSLGVVAVYTGAEMERLIVPGPYGIAVMMGGDGPRFSLLATDKVRLVGDLVALVVADSRAAAEDGCDLIDVEYEELDPVASAAAALDPTSPPIFDDLGSNVLAGPVQATYGDVDGVFAAADRVVRVTISQHRHQNVPMETRGVVASYDPADGSLLVWSANQGVHAVRSILADRLGMDPQAVRVRTGDVGGSFGLKFGAAREDVAVAAASRELGRPVKWIEDRYEHLMASGHAREETLDVEAAVRDDGEILGLRVRMTVDTGAYPGMGAVIPSIVQAMFPGPYRIRALAFEHTAVVTNKASYVAYRGPWAAETFVRERLVNIVAAELGLDPVAVRMRNVIRADEQPAQMVTGPTVAGVTAAESLERMQQVVDMPAFRERQARERARGRYLGLGLATFIEAAPGVRRGEQPLGEEQLWMSVAGDGTVVVYSAQMPHGQGHETTLAQIAADQMGVPFEAVRVVFGDTDVVPAGFTGGSRAATMAGGAALTTARALRAKVLDVAAQELEANPEDLTIAGGEVFVAGEPAGAMTLADVAAAAARRGGEAAAALRVEGVYDGGMGGWSGGTHCAAVEVDLQTGLVTVERYVVVEDCGELINPAIVDGQIRGGVAQGIGAVLLERSAYDEAGNYLSATFMDYLLPTAMTVPRIEIHHLQTVPLDPDVNFRGVGEGGMLVAPPALVNAIEDALSPFGVRILEQHLPPARVLELAGVISPAG